MVRMNRRMRLGLAGMPDITAGDTFLLISDSCWARGQWWAAKVDCPCFKRYNIIWMLDL